jgi:hypothetical protein
MVVELAPAEKLVAVAASAFFQPDLIPPHKPFPQLLGQHVPGIRSYNRRAFPHFAFNHQSVIIGILYPTTRTLFDIVDTPNQNDRFSYIHDFRLILVRFCAGPGISICKMLFS